MSESQPLFVRLPAPAAEQLERITSSSGASKREVVTRLILGDELTVGQHQFHPAQEPTVLTAAQAAELLQVEEDLVVQLAETGELPGRCLVSKWRFSRPALLAWLGGHTEWRTAVATCAPRSVLRTEDTASATCPVSDRIVRRTPRSAR